MEQSLDLTIEIRELRDEDVKPLALIEENSFSMPWSEQDFRNLLQRDYCTYIVALAEGKVVGCCGYTNCCGEANIDNVVVAKEYRNQGIACAMLTALIEKGKAENIEAYTLEVRVSNQAAIHVYEKLGFVSEGIRPRFYERPTEDACIMWKR